MGKEVSAALRMTVITLLLTGVVYPLVATGLAQVLFRSRAGGSLVKDEAGHVVGSSLLAQPFRKAAYLQPRPSAAGKKGYDAASSSGSNLGPTSKALRDRVVAEVRRLRKENPSAPLPIPAELVTASASGLDPDVTLAGALWQVGRVAAARGVSSERVESLVRELAAGRSLGFLGEPRVNVLLANLALDRQFGAPR